MNKLLLLLTIFSSVNIFSQKNYNVVYGEKEMYYKPTNINFGLFLDKNGDLYPKQLIPSKDLIANKGSLKEYYQNNGIKFIQVTNKYGLDFKEFSTVNYNHFQEVLSNKNINKINHFSKDANLYILIHGFRKPFLKQKRGTTSIKDYNTLKSSILKIDANAKFIEIFWDGMYGSFFGKNSSSLNVIFKLYENEGQQNATVTGYALRKIISKIALKKYNIITHSLGAQVGISLLTNTYQHRISKDYFKMQTPSQPNINMFMVAPAMSKEPFKEYYNRTTNVNFTKNDNYNLSILYNEKDVVLRKKLFVFGPGPKKYGNTTLGCNHKNEIIKLQTMFTKDYKKSNFKAFNTTTTKDHRIKYYVKTESFIEHIKELSE